MWITLMILGGLILVIGVAIPEELAKAEIVLVGPRASGKTTFLEFLKVKKVRRKTEQTVAEGDSLNLDGVGVILDWGGMREENHPNLQSALSAGKKVWLFIPLDTVVASSTEGCGIKNEKQRFYLRRNLALLLEDRYKEEMTKKVDRVIFTFVDRLKGFSKEYAKDITAFVENNEEIKSVLEKDSELKKQIDYWKRQAGNKVTYLPLNPFYKEELIQILTQLKKELYKEKK